MSKKFEYRVSIIVPIYNAEKHLRECLDSLVMQTISYEDMEVLLINDGSTDGSLKICKEYETIYPFFKIIDKENGGVSSARNEGIKLSKGKYIMYLDSDDRFSEETVKNVIDYFDEIYDMVDVVTFKRVMYFENRPPVLISRYKYLKEQGIYDLEKVPYCTQMTLNVAIKNEKKFFFDTSLYQGEDQKYVIQHILPTLKLGYCKNAEYQYVRHEESAVSTQSYSFYLFEQHMQLWEGVLRDKREIPKYMQAIILDNWNWELRGDCLFPYHYKGKDFENAMTRIRNILSYIEIDTIMKHPNMDFFHKHFWISMKDNTNIAFIADNDRHMIVNSQQIVYESNKMEIILHQIDIEDEKIRFLGFIKSPIFNYIQQKPKLYFDIDGEIVEIELFESIHSYYGTTAHTNYFWGFRLVYDIKEIESMRLFVEMDGIRYKTEFYCMPAAIFNKNVGIESYIRKGWLIQFNMLDSFKFRRISEEAQYEIEKNRKFNDKAENSEVYKLRRNVLNNRNNQRIWLYSDGTTASIDNAYYQFQYDWNKNDEIERYYVYACDYSEIESLFSGEQRNKLIKYGSNLHKYLFLKAEYTLCSFSDKKPRIPFSTDKEYSYYRDLRQPQMIYLQHGVCHADLRYLQSAERCKINKIVVSSDFEKDNFIKNYNFCEEDIITAGMARFDYMNKASVPKNKIIFAPSWRSYLMSKGQDANWSKIDTKVLKSEYFLNIQKFLTSQKLQHLLEKYDMFLDVKLHPHMSTMAELMMSKCNRIRVMTENIDLEEYKVFITDFSSFVFDFVYLKRPIFYFVPDMEQFESGMNHYRKLDLPFEEGFGKLTISSEEAIDELERILNNDCKNDEIFDERMARFFCFTGKCEENLYQYLKNRK